MFIRILRIGMTIAVLCPALAWSQCNVDPVEYDIVLDPTWSSGTLPNDFPMDPHFAHFSPLVAGSHNSDVSFWEPGALASPGIEQMAETGGTALLKGEIDAAIGAEMALDVFAGSPGSIPSPAGSATATIDLDKDSPLATVVSMIAPSPDWFVGVHGLNLYSNGNWLDGVTVELFPYDAGTDAGTTYTAANANTLPPRPPITALTSDYFKYNGELVPFGTFSFELNTAGCTDTDGDGVPDISDLDDDNDNVIDIYDMGPLNAINAYCTTVGDDATLSNETILDQKTCAASNSVSVDLTEVTTGAPTVAGFGLVGGDLHVISPTVAITSLEVRAGAKLTVINADPSCVGGEAAGCP